MLKADIVVPHLLGGQTIWRRNSSLRRKSASSVPSRQLCGARTPAQSTGRTVAKLGASLKTLIHGVRMPDDRMARNTVVLKLNQQQLELIDRTIAAGAAIDREALIRRALREYAAKRALQKLAQSKGAAS
jgi:Ribbon-helix-helix protein, copG family